jgi:hypothetical protein
MNVFKVEVIDPTREIYNVKTVYSKKEATDFIKFNSSPDSFGHIEKERSKKERFALGFPTHSGRTTTAQTDEYYIGTKKVSYEEAMSNIRRLNEIAEKTKMNPTKGKNMRHMRRNPTAKEQVVYLSFDEAEMLVDRIAERTEQFNYSMSNNEKTAMAQLLSAIGVKVSDLIDVSILADNYAINAEIVTPSDYDNYDMISVKEEALFSWEEDGYEYFCLGW